MMAEVGWQDEQALPGLWDGPTDAAVAEDGPIEDAENSSIQMRLFPLQGIWNTNENFYKNLQFHFILSKTLHAKQKHIKTHI